MSIVSYIYQDTDLRIGCHVPKQGGFFNSLYRFVDTPLTSFQIYLKNRGAFSHIVVDVQDLQDAREYIASNNFFLCIHATLLYNLCGSVNGEADPELVYKAGRCIDYFTEELDCGVGLGCGVVVHIGACKDREFGIRKIIENIEKCLQVDSILTSTIAKSMGISKNEVKRKRRIYLENSAGEGNKIGKNLTEISEILNGLQENFREQVSVCIDTAHIFGAGEYNFGNPKDFDTFVEEFTNRIGLDKLSLFHLNDSRVPFASKKDRHENLTVGHIFSDNGCRGLKYLLSFVRQYRIPCIGEPPDKDADGKKAPGWKWDLEIITRLVPDLLIAK